MGSECAGRRTGKGTYPRDRRSGYTCELEAADAAAWSAIGASSGTEADHGVIAAHVDVPVVHKEGVGEARQGARGPHRCRWRSAPRSGCRWSSPAQPGSPASRCNQQVMKRRVRQHDAEPVLARSHVAGDRCRPGLSAQQHDRPGRSIPATPARRRTPWHSAAAMAESGTMTAKGLSTRSLRRRSSRTATGLVASHARWKPPSPLTARMPPSASRCRAYGWQHRPCGLCAPWAAVEPGVSSQTCGPQTGQATGWA